MSTALNILHIEDNPLDSDLIRLRLRSEGYLCNIDVADSELTVRSLLASKHFDLILCDYSLPGYDGLSVLKHVRELDGDVPFIFISGTIGEARAIDALKSGATDYILKDDLARLGAAIRRALLESEERRKRKAAEIALVDSEASFRLLFANNPHPMWVDNLETLEFLEVNEAAIRKYGYSRDEFLRMKVSDLHPLDDVPRLARLINENFTSGGFSTGWRHKLKNGSVIDVEVTAHVLEFSGKKASIVIAQDITERKQAAEALQLFRALLDRSSDIIEVLDPVTGKFIDVNEAACREHGYSREELLRMSMRDIDPTFGSSGVLVNEVGSSKPATFESRHLRKDGTSFPVEVRAALVTLDRDFIVAIVRDITERKRSEEDLKKSEDRYRTLFEESQDALFISSPDDHFVDINPAGLQMYGFASVEEACSINLSTQLFVDPVARDVYLRELHSKGSVKDYELLLKKTNGDQIIVLETSTVIRDEAGKITGYRGINRDITEKKNFEAQLLRTQRLESIGTLASGVAHDLNNVLGPIMMAVELLKKLSPDPAAKALLSTLESSATRGADIVRQVLTFARGAGGDRIPVQVKHLVTELETIIRQTFPKSIELVVDFPKDLSLVLADPTQLQQVLLNLCVNARDAMPGGGTITIRAGVTSVSESLTAAVPNVSPGDFVVITVSDTGSGIPSEHLDKIFDPFFTTKEIGKGTGLGLSTARGIVKSLGGFLGVKSELGKGTTFTVNLPAIDTGEILSSVSKPELSAGHGELVLIVDDEESIVTIASLILESSGYRVISATSGLDALALYATHKRDISIIVSDLMMPGLDGGEMIQRLRKMNTNARIVLMTGLPQEAEALRDAGIAVDVILEKPFTANTMLQAVSKVLAP